MNCNELVYSQKLVILPYSTALQKTIFSIYVKEITRLEKKMKWIRSLRRSKMRNFITQNKISLFFSLRSPLLIFCAYRFCASSLPHVYSIQHEWRKRKNKTDNGIISERQNKSNRLILFLRTEILFFSFNFCVGFLFISFRFWAMIYSKFQPLWKILYMTLNAKSIQHASLP